MEAGGRGLPGKNYVDSRVEHAWCAVGELGGGQQGGHCGQSE